MARLMPPLGSTVFLPGEEQYSMNFFLCRKIAGRDGIVCVPTRGTFEPQQGGIEFAGVYVAASEPKHLSVLELAAFRGVWPRLGVS
jgi:hypothetical protein